MEVDLLLLALEDIVPVVLSGIGLWVLSRVARSRSEAAGALTVTGFGLIVAGGATKPIYKLIVASSDLDPVILDDLLFWFLAPGFLTFAAGLASARAGSGRRVRFVVAFALLVELVAAALLVAGSSAWFPVLLATATCGNLWLVVVLVRWSRSVGERAAAAMFVGNVAIVFGLSWAAATLVQTIGVQWLEQLSSTFAQALFLAGAIRLSRSLRSGVPLASSEPETQLRAG